MIPAAIAVPAGAALLEGIGSFMGNRSQSRAAQRAADAQIAAQQDALNFQKQMYGDLREGYHPYQEAGQRGVTGFEDRITNFNQPTFGYQQRDFNLTNWKDPGYDYRLAEAQKLIDASTASKGMTLGSGALKSLQTRGQEMGSQEYQNAYDRYLKDSAMRYGQANNQYDRDYTFKNQDITNWQNLMNAGMYANQGIAGLFKDTVTGMTPLITGQGEAAGNAALAQGGAASSGWSNLGSGAGNLLKNIGNYYWGVK